MNTLPAVFNSSDKKHRQFVPILDHVNKEKSKITIGGSTYNAELGKMPALFKILAEMRRSKKLVIADTTVVDSLEGEIAKKYPDKSYPDFNDKHIVALVYASNAKLLCTVDKPLQRYVKISDSYNKGKSRPLIFNDRSKPSVLPSGGFKPTCKLC